MVLIHVCKRGRASRTPIGRIPDRETIAWVDMPSRTYRVPGPDLVRRYALPARDIPQRIPLFDTVDDTDASSLLRI